MPKKLNELMREELARTFAQVQDAVLLDLTGVDSEQTYALRKLVRERGVQLRVVKNTLAVRALKACGFEVDPSLFQGSVAIAFDTDPAQVARTFADFRRQVPDTSLRIKGGFLERRPISREKVEELAALPGREQLLGMVVGSIAAPLTAFINVHAGLLRKLLYALNAIKEQREGGGGEPPAAAA
ncbi:MAG: 50S ribosomal protein L10 [Planctomycetota bacterium]|nr:MAG: 50S ribosomal protein L10 [Planctomycetota bacterium]